eukprot:4483834-Pyramimonas_sp.AAC.1
MSAAFAGQGVRQGRVQAPGAMRSARGQGRPRTAGVELDLIHKAGPAASAVWGRSGHSGTAGSAAVGRSAAAVRE